jgi:hypothetical protein
MLLNCEIGLPEWAKEAIFFGCARSINIELVSSTPIVLSPESRCFGRGDLLAACAPRQSEAAHKGRQRDPGLPIKVVHIPKG